MVATPVKEFEDTLWKAADKLRGSMDDSQYKDIVLGLVFLKYVTDAFDDARRLELEAEMQAEGASAEGKRGGEFYTPRSLVRTLVEILEPTEGRVYDPACGSGNFLIVAYRELRKIETDVIVAIREREGTTDLALDISWEQKLSIGQFYGIELNWWPARIAETAMFLVDHQANRELADRVGLAPDRLPISITAHIEHANALAVDWLEILPETSGMTYIFGNPPFIGARMKNKEQKADLARVWGTTKGVNDMDYVTGWHAQSRTLLAKRQGEFAFVATNSITQGQPVPALFGPLTQDGWRIKFAHRTFAWDSEAPGKAAVHCVIVGFTKNRAVKQRLWDYPEIHGGGWSRVSRRGSMPTWLMAQTCLSPHGAHRFPRNSSQPGSEAWLMTAATSSWKSTSTTRLPLTP